MFKIRHVFPVRGEATTAGTPILIIFAACYTNRLNMQNIQQTLPLCIKYHQNIYIADGLMLKKLKI